MGHYSYYLKCRLQELGYPALSLELHECSGFVQGSGVAWYGRLAAMDLHALARRMISEQARSPHDSFFARLLGRKEGKRLLELLTFMDTLKTGTVEIYTKGEKGGDHHAYSMGIDDQLDWDQISAMTTQGQGELEIYQRQWQRLIEWLQEDLERSSSPSTPSFATSSSRKVMRGPWSGCDTPPASRWRSSRRASPISTSSMKRANP